jgi:hypothetical protein
VLILYYHALAIVAISASFVKTERMSVTDMKRDFKTGLAYVHRASKGSNPVDILFLSLVSYSMHVTYEYSVLQEISPMLANCATRSLPWPAI